MRPLEYEEWLTRTAPIINNSKLKSINVSKSKTCVTAFHFEYGLQLLIIDPETLHSDLSWAIRPHTSDLRYIHAWRDVTQALFVNKELACAEEIDIVSDDGLDAKVLRLEFEDGSSVDIESPEKVIFSYLLEEDSTEFSERESDISDR